MTFATHDPPLRALPEREETGTQVPGPVRTCVGCRRVRPRDELARLVRSSAGVRYDRDRHLPGRGASLCPDLTCIASANRRDAAALRRALRGAPVGEIREALDALRTAIVAGEMARHTGTRTAGASETTAPGGPVEPSPDDGVEVPLVGTVRSHRT